MPRQSPAGAVRRCVRSNSMADGRSVSTCRRTAKFSRKKTSRRCQSTPKAGNSAGRFTGRDAEHEAAAGKLVDGRRGLAVCTGWRSGRMMEPVASAMPSSGRRSFRATPRDRKPARGRRSSDRAATRRASTRRRSPVFSACCASRYVAHGRLITPVRFDRKEHSDGEPAGREHAPEARMADNACGGVGCEHGPHPATR